MNNKQFVMPSVSTKTYPYINISTLNKQLRDTLEKIYDEYRPALRLNAKMTNESNKTQLPLMGCEVMKKFRQTCREEIDERFKGFYVSRVMQRISGYESYQNLPYIIKDLKYAVQALDTHLKEHASIIERYIIALRSININYSPSAQLQKISLKLTIPRIKAIRQGTSNAIKLMNDKNTKKVFQQKIVPLIKAEKIYGRIPIEKDDYDVILAGGDATRYHQEIKNAISELKKNNNYILSKEWKESWATITRTSLYISQLGKLYHYVPEHQERDQIIDQMELLMRKFESCTIPKLLNYGFSCDFYRKRISVTFFMNAVLKYYAALLKTDSYGKTLIFVVKKSIVKRTLQQMMGSLYDYGIISRSRLSVMVIDTLYDAVPLSPEDYTLVFDRSSQLMASSAGHGPAYIMMSQYLNPTIENPKVFTIRTLDNGGVYTGHYLGLLKQILSAENDIRDQLVEALKQQDNHRIAQIIQYPLPKTQTDQRVLQRVRKFVFKRWDHELASDLNGVDMAEKLSTLPMTAAYVVSHDATSGGGLVVNQAGCMSIVDKRPDNHRAITYFNPMMFATLCKEPVNEALDEKLLFTTKKCKNGQWIVQAESASTHIATYPETTLKRIIRIPKHMKKQIFSEQKRVGQSDISYNESISLHLKKDIHRVFKACHLKVDTFTDVLNRIQETAINFLHSRQIKEDVYIKLDSVEPYKVEYLGFDTINGSVARNLINQN